MADPQRRLRLLSQECFLRCMPRHLMDDWVTLSFWQRNCLPVVPGLCPVLDRALPRLDICEWLARSLTYTFTVSCETPTFRERKTPLSLEPKCARELLHGEASEVLWPAAPSTTGADHCLGDGMHGFSESHECQESLSRTLAGLAIG